MGNARIIASLYARRRRLVLGLADFERRAGVYRAAIEEVEAELHKLVLFVPPLVRRNHRCSPFARGELARLTLDIMRQAGEPLTMHTIAVRALAAKGVALPDPRTMRRIRIRLQQVMSGWSKRGLVVSVGEGRRTVRALAADCGGAVSSLPQNPGRALCQRKNLKPT